VNNKILVLVVTAILASGCTLPENSSNNNSNGDNGPDLAEDRGLQIESFRTSDETLRPSQPAKVNLRLKNYHTRDIDIEEISIYNEGLLTVENRECNPDPDSLGQASEGNYPEMECQWDIEAPPEEEYGSFDSKPASMNLRLRYDSSLTNEDPFKLEFKELDEINNTEDISKTFSNSEVSMNIETEEPVPLDSGRTLIVKTEEIGQGRIVADTNYDFEFTPSNLFEDCDREDAPVVGKELEFSCEVTGSNQEGTRNLIFSTDYKYVKEPVLNIKLVNNQ